MTVHYQHIVATERVGGFFRLLFRWRGSIYKHVFGEISIFLVLYYMINFSYRFAMNEYQKRKFELFCKYCGGFTDYIPVTFVVGFYVVRVIVRRWTQWENMPWPERLAFDVSTYIQGTDVMTRMIRRTILRYTNLASILCFRDICVPAKKRFPNIDHLLIAGLITPKELEMYTKTSSNFDINWWIPFHWAYTLIWKTMQEGKVSEGGMMRLHDGINDLRNRCWVLFMHDWIPIPMVYTQVCTLSVYIYMLSCLFGRQYVNPPDAKPGDHLDLYVPIFTIFQMIFYLGWMKVAEVLINPLGMDADDFDMNYIIDRNLRTSYTIVDYAFQRLPPLEKDVHWDLEEPQLPHTENSEGAAAQPFTGSTANVSVSGSDSRSERGSTVELNSKDDTKLLGGRKISKNSDISSTVQSRDRVNSVATRFKRLLSRQHTASSNRTLHYDESKLDAMKDLLDVEDGGDRVANWHWSASPDRSPQTGSEKIGRWHRLPLDHESSYNKSTMTLPRIDEVDHSEDNTLTKITGAPLAPKLRSFTTAPPARLRNPDLLSESEQQDILMDLLRSSTDVSNSPNSSPSLPSVYRPRQEEGTRFTTAAVQQDAGGMPVGSALLPPVGHEGTEAPPPASGTCEQRGQEGSCGEFYGGGRFDMTHMAGH